MFNYSKLDAKDRMQLILTPLVFSLMMGGGIGIWARRPYDSLVLNVPYWFGEVGAAVMIYLLIIFAGKGIFGFGFRARFSGHWRFTLLAMGVISVMNLTQALLTLHVLSPDPAASYQANSTFNSMSLGRATVLLLFQVGLTLAIGEMAMVATRYWEVMERFLAVGLAAPPESERSANEIGENKRDENKNAGMIPLGKGDDRRMIRAADISHIEVTNHFSTIVYLSGEGWRQWGEYVSLAEMERRCADLVRISRSVLVNPEKITGVEKSGRQFLLRMAGAPDVPLRVSRSRTRMISEMLRQEGPAPRLRCP